MQGIELLRSLRAVRRFSSEPIPDDVLHAILEAARWTGSSKNTQPWELIVIRDRGVLRELSTLGRYAGHLAGAAMGIALVMEGTVSASAFDAGRLSQNIMLAAWGHGIGTCIASLYPEDNERRAAEVLGVPADRSMHTIISLGYPADPEARRLSGGPSDVRAVVPRGRKPLNEMVHWERYNGRAG